MKYLREGRGAKSDSKTLRKEERENSLEDLNHCYPRLTLVGDTSFATNSHNHAVVLHRSDEVTERFGVTHRVGINLRSEQPSSASRLVR